MSADIEFSIESEDGGYNLHMKSDDGMIRQTTWLTWDEARQLMQELYDEFYNTGTNKHE